MARDEYQSVSPRKSELQDWKRFCQLNDTRLAEDPSPILVLRSMFKLAKRAKTGVTGEEAETAIVPEVTRPIAESAERPSSTAEPLASPANTTDSSDKPERGNTEESRSVQTRLNWNQDFVERRLVHQEKRLELDQRKFEWREKALDKRIELENKKLESFSAALEWKKGLFDRKLDLEENRLDIAKEIVEMRRHRSELEERIVIGHSGSSWGRDPICGYCNQRGHFPSNCPELKRDSGRIDSRFGDLALPQKIIDVSPRKE